MQLSTHIYVGLMSNVYTFIIQVIENVPQYTLTAFIGKFIRVMIIKLNITL